MKQKEIVIMGSVIQTFLSEKKLENAKPKDLMQVLVNKGFFKQDHRAGLPLRNILRDLDNKGLLYLLPQVSVERKKSNRNWYFNLMKI